MLGKLIKVAALTTIGLATDQQDQDYWPPLRMLITLWSEVCTPLYTLEEQRKHIGDDNMIKLRIMNETDIQK